MAFDLAVSWSLQIVLIAVGAELASSLLRGHHPRTRFRLRIAAVALALMMPLLPHPLAKTAAGTLASETVNVFAGQVMRAATAFPDDGRTALVFLWSLVAAIRLIRVARGLRDLSVLSRDARGDGGARHPGPRVVESSLVSTPASSFWGDLILVPQSFSDQPDTWRQAVIAHETIHLKNRHGLALLFEECVLALLWFHPAMTLLISRLRDAREENVDALTVAMVGEPQAYRDMLLALASKSHFLAPAVSGTTALSSRIQSLIALEKNTMPRHSISRSVLASLALAGVAAITPVLAAQTAPAESQKENAVTAEGGAADKTRVVERQKISSVAPVFPEAFKEKKISGLVILMVDINAAGEVTNVVPARAGDHPELVAASIDAVKQWKYEPADKPSKQETVFSFTFRAPARP